MTAILPISEIKNLISNNELNLALQSLELYLQHNHSDNSAIKLYQKVKSKIYAQNLRQVKASMQKIEFMWTQKRYYDLLELYLKIEQYAPNYKPLQTKIQKVYKKILESEKQNNQSKIVKVNTIVQGYLKTKNYTQALDFIMEAIKSDASNASLQKLLIETKRQIIDLKLKQNKSQLNSNNIPEIFDFIKKLYELEPTYFKTQKLLSATHKKLQKYYQIKEAQYTEDAKKQIQILFNQGNYQKSLQACKDLLRYNKQNKFAKKYFLKNQGAIDNQNFKTAYKLINS